MNKLSHIILGITTFLISFNLFGQSEENCFLDDFELRIAEIPLSVSAEKPTDLVSVAVTITSDTLGKVSKYVFGNAIAAWAGPHDNPLFVEGVELLSPTLIRFPGGSWSNGYFWNGIPPDVPDSIYDGTTYNQTTGTANKSLFYGQSGVSGDITTPDQYYALRENANVSEGLITVNYAYARYSTSQDPVAQAAHLAADWVRYDNGRTKFWEVGNENGGPWEYGWMIDTTLNQDGQPVIITGELYGKHFNVFVDSMKAAAAEIGTTIYVGGQVVIYGPDSWNFVDKTWNEGFFKEVGDKADFYVVHSYFGFNYQVRYLLNVAVSEPKKQLDFLKQDFTKFNASPKPVALTEYNMGLGASDEQATSYINGMQAVILMCEMVKNNYGLGARWLLLSWVTQMFYSGPEAAYAYHARPEFYYLHYLPKFYGDHAISTISSNSNILCYASKFSSGESGVVIVNKGTIDYTIGLNMSGVGDKYYVYSFSGGTDDPEFSQNIYINGYGPDETQWGPYNELSDIPANEYPVDDEIKVTSAARSVQLIMIEGGNNSVTNVNDANTTIPHSYNLYQNFPNPFNPSSTIDFELSKTEKVLITIYNVLGEKIRTLYNGVANAGKNSVRWDGRNEFENRVSSGVYFYRLQTESGFIKTKKMILMK